MQTDKQYYTTANGTSYDINTDKKIVSILDDAIINRKRFKSTVHKRDISY